MPARAISGTQSIPQASADFRYVRTAGTEAKFLWLISIIMAQVIELLAEIVTWLSCCDSDHLHAPFIIGINGDSITQTECLFDLLVATAGQVCYVFN